MKPLKEYRRISVGGKRTIDEHRVIAMEKIGRVLRRNEVVHHLDGDKMNNAPENLAVMTRAKHTKISKPWQSGDLGAI